MSNRRNRPTGAGTGERILEVAAGIGMFLLQLVSWVWDGFQNFLHRMKTSRQYRQRFISMMVLPATAWYYEIVFNLSTEHTMFRSRAWLFTLLFSLCWGLFYYLFCSISRRPRLNRRLIKVFQILMMLPYGVEYFIYRQFHIFYDLKTILAGGSNAMKEFGGTILKMIFSPVGLLHLFLFMLPFLLYYWKGPDFDAAKRISRKFRIRVIIGLVVIHLIALLLIAAGGNYRSVYGNKYTFKYAINDFGIQTAFRKELMHLVSGKSAGSFQNLEPAEEEKTEAETEANAVVEATPTPEPEKVKKEYSTIDIDFAGKGEVPSNAEIEELNSYVQSLTPSKTNEYTGLFEGKNLIFFSAEAFSPWFVSEELTPTLYRLIHKGIYFTDYYQMAGSGTTGGELQNLLGVEPMNGGDSMLGTLSHNNYFTMGSQLDRLGYYGRTFHNNEYRFYDRVETHNNLGYSDTFLGYGNGIEAFVTAQWPESDLEMMQGTLPTYIDKQPFNTYYMTVSGHGVYTVDDNAMSAKNYDRVANTDYYEDVKCYIAANLELEDALAYTVKELETKGIADNTVIVLTADHFPYGLVEDEYLEQLYGHAITNSLERDENALIIWSGCLEKMDPIQVNDPVSSIDILPTLSNLFGTEWDSRLMPGRDVFSDAEPIVFNMEYDWKTDKGAYIYSEDRFIPSAEGIEVDEPYIDRITTIVGNKLHMCSLLLNNDYFGYLFGKNDTQKSEEEVEKLDMSMFDENAEETGVWGLPEEDSSGTGTDETGGYEDNGGADETGGYEDEAGTDETGTYEETDGYEDIGEDYEEAG